MTTPCVRVGKPMCLAKDVMVYGNKAHPEVENSFSSHRDQHNIICVSIRTAHELVFGVA